MLALAAGLGALALAGMWGFLVLTNLNRGDAAGFWVLRNSSALIHALALGWICRAGWLVSHGHAFGRMMPVLLARLGWTLAVAALADLLFVPWLLKWAYPALWSGLGHYNPAYVALAVLGGLLVLIAAMLRRATDMADELEGFL